MEDRKRKKKRQKENMINRKCNEIAEISSSISVVTINTSRQNLYIKRINSSWQEWDH